ncbi:MAG TPA: HK97 family phage prohead protease [Chloroflexota bacterium]|nr:HK97 family phage prohead protease [Chloroflexota bacterium]
MSDFLSASHSTADVASVPLSYKRFSASIKARTSDDGTKGEIEAIVSVFGNVDSVREVITAGAFTKSLARKFPKGVWMHDWAQPVARTEEARELLPGDALLPESLKEQGGLYIRGKFNLETQRGREAYSDIAFGIVDEFSIGYRVLKAHRVTEEGEHAEEDMDDLFGYFFGRSKGIRYLDEIELYEWSPVLVGANPSTALLGVKTGHAPIPDLIDHSLAQLAAVCEAAKALQERRAKEGRTFSAANAAALEGYAAKLDDVAAELRSLLATAPPPERADADAAKGQEDPSAPAAVKADPDEGRRLFAEYQRLVARLNGVPA